MKTTWLLIACALVFSASLAQGAEYFIYRNPAGKIVLSNVTPPAGAEIVRRHELQDVSDEAVRAAREEEQSFWRRLKDEQLAESNQRLAESKDRLAEAIITAAALRETEPEVLIQVASSHASRFRGLFMDRGRIPERSHIGFRHTNIR
jgi:hypothetical protein